MTTRSSKGWKEVLQRDLITSYTASDLEVYLNQNGNGRYRLVFGICGEPGYLEDLSETEVEAKLHALGIDPDRGWS